MGDRIIRIVPLYWITTFIMAFGGKFKLFPNLHSNLSGLLKSLLFIPYMQDGIHIWPILIPGWTLNYEMFFYIIFSAMLKKSPKYRLICMTILFTGLSIIGLYMNISDVLQKFYTNSLILEFIMGIYVAALCQKAPERNAGSASLLVFGGLAAFVAVCIHPLHTIRVLEWGAPATILVAGAVRLEQAGVFSGKNIFTRIGDASYSIYLTQALAISFCVKFLPIGFYKYGWLITAICSIIAGIATYEVVEKRLMRATQFLKGMQFSVTSSGKLNLDSK